MSITHRAIWLHHSSLRTSARMRSAFSRILCSQEVVRMGDRSSLALVAACFQGLPDACTQTYTQALSKVTHATVQERLYCSRWFYLELKLLCPPHILPWSASFLMPARTGCGCSEAWQAHASPELFAFFSMTSVRPPAVPSQTQLAMHKLLVS